MKRNNSYYYLILSETLLLLWLSKYINISLFWYTNHIPLFIIYNSLINKGIDIIKWEEIINHKRKYDICNSINYHLYNNINCEIIFLKQTIDYHCYIYNKILKTKYFWF